MRAHPAGPRHGEVVHDPGLPALPEDLDALEPKVWAERMSRDHASGALSLAGHDVRDLVERHGTPLMLLDEADVRSRMREWRAAFAPDGDVFYAAKAFLCTELARWVAEEGLGLDVCTGGELAVALRAGFPPDRITVHGNNKAVPEILAVLDAGVGRVVVDSFEELARLAFHAEERGTRVKVLVRVTVGVEAHTHEFIATAHEDQKFGFSLAGGAAAEAVRRALRMPSLELIGLHSHIGSQIFDTSAFEVSAHRVTALAAEVRDEHGVELEELDLGGGLGIAYVGSDDPMLPAEVAQRLREIVERECSAAGLRVPRLVVEPGRAVVGRSTCTVYEVGTVKPVDLDASPGARTYVSVDGGMSDNIRTALYDAEYTVVLASRASSAPAVLSRVVGKHCESGDVVVKDAWLPGDVAPGDLLAVAATGAYCRSMASTYNYVPRPPVVGVRTDGSERVLLRRENDDDLLSLDPHAGPPP